MRVTRCSRKIYSRKNFIASIRIPLSVIIDIQVLYISNLCIVLQKKYQREAFIFRMHYWKVSKKRNITIMQTNRVKI